MSFIRAGSRPSAVGTGDCRGSAQRRIDPTASAARDSLRLCSSACHAKDWGQKIVRIIREIAVSHHSHYKLDTTSDRLIPLVHGPLSESLSSRAAFRVIVRGNQRRKTLRSDEDYKVYLDRLDHDRGKFRFRAYAYRLMPNHVHVLLETGAAPLGKFMQGLQ